jgi:transposase InsO family protein
MCGILEVCPGGYYAWRGRPVSVQQQRQDALIVNIQAIHQEFKARYGSPRIHAELKARKHSCCVNTVAENVLNRQFNPSAANEVWLADFTYIWTREGWLYLAVVEDLYSRMAVGWSMADDMTSRLVVDALEMAVQRRLPGENLLAHSDRGSQYASEHYQRLLAQHGILCSMSRKGDCWDNAPMESFFASLKKELIHGVDFATRAEARAAVFEYIEVFYNRQRRHSTLGYQSPAEFEETARESQE